MTLKCFKIPLHLKCITMKNLSLRLKMQHSMISYNLKFELPLQSIVSVFYLFLSRRVTTIVTPGKKRCRIDSSHPEIRGHVVIRYRCMVQESNIHHILTEEREGSKDRDGVHRLIGRVVVSPTSVQQKSSCIISTSFQMTLIEIKTPTSRPV